MKFFLNRPTVLYLKVEFVFKFQYLCLVYINLLLKYLRHSQSSILVGKYVFNIFGDSDIK